MLKYIVIIIFIISFQGVSASPEMIYPQFFPEDYQNSVSHHNVSILDVGFAQYYIENDKAVGLLGKKLFTDDKSFSPRFYSFRLDGKNKICSKVFKKDDKTSLIFSHLDVGYITEISNQDLFSGMIDYVMEDSLVSVLKSKEIIQFNMKGEILQNIKLDNDYPSNHNGKLFKCGENIYYHSNGNICKISNGNTKVVWQGDQFNFANTNDWRIKGDYLYYFGSGFSWTYIDLIDSTVITSVGKFMPPGLAARDKKLYYIDENDNLIEYSRDGAKRTKIYSDIAFVEGSESLLIIERSGGIYQCDKDFNKKLIGISLPLSYYVRSCGIEEDILISLFEKVAVPYYEYQLILSDIKSDQFKRLQIANSLAYSMVSGVVYYQGIDYKIYSYEFKEDKEIVLDSLSEYVDWVFAEEGLCYYSVNDSIYSIDLASFSKKIVGVDSFCYPIKITEDKMVYYELADSNNEKYYTIIVKNQTDQTQTDFDLNLYYKDVLFHRNPKIENTLYSISKQSPESGAKFDIVFLDLDTYGIYKKIKLDEYSYDVIPTKNICYHVKSGEELFISETEELIYSFDGYPFASVGVGIVDACVYNNMFYFIDNMQVVNKIELPTSVVEEETNKLDQFEEGSVCSFPLKIDPFLSAKLTHPNIIIYL